MIVATVLGAATLCLCLLPLWSPPGSLPRQSIFALPALTSLGLFTVVYAIHANPDTADKWIYVRELRAISSVDLRHAFSVDLRTSAEPAYVAFFWLLSRLGISHEGLFGVVAVLGVTATVAGAAMLLPTWRLPFALLVAVSLGFLPSFSSVVVRQGVAMSLLLIGVCLILRGHRLSWMPVLALATQFHWSALPLVLLVTLVALVRPRLGLTLVVWSVAAVLFLTGVQVRVLGPVATSIPEIAEYTDPAIVAHYTGGVNRLDFFALSAVLLAAGVYFCRLSTTPPWYPRLVSIYATLNVYFLLFGFIAYSDRLGAYSWTLAPLLLGAPISRDGSRLARLATASVVAFTVVAGFAIGPYEAMCRLIHTP